MLNTQSMNLDLIRTFVIVGQSKDFNDAASKLKIDATNVSRHIKALEQLMGTKLINKNAKNYIELTEDGKITFLHKIKDGSIDKSYGIHVAKLANLPDSLIMRANEILASYENKGEVEVKNQISFDLSPKEESVVEEKIRKLNPLEMTPLDALNTIFELKRDLDK